MESTTLSKNKNNSIVLNIIKGSFWGVAFSLVCILLFAFVIKFTSISENAISPVNQIIKVLSIFFACFVASKKINSHGWLVGIFVGLIYSILSFLIFSVLDGHFSVGINVLNDIAFGSVLGLISGIITIGLRKK
ncbi:MAG: TIGR04086 family membrane protein [Clostridia bacterium]|nr:TIGR04086 family membrane protein [Clostridia bacterium]